MPSVATGWTRSRSGWRGEEKNLVPISIIEWWNLDCSSRSLVSIPTELSQIESKSVVVETDSSESSESGYIVLLPNLSQNIILPHPSRCFKRLSSQKYLYQKLCTHFISPLAPPQWDCSLYTPSPNTTRWQQSQIWMNRRVARWSRASRCSLAWLTIRLWRWRYFLPKRQLSFPGLQSVTFQRQNSSTVGEIHTWGSS
jgi:hypothetical protein